METNDLMKSLERMKSVLTDIQSAKQQVEKTVNSYDGLNSTTAEYVSKLGTITTKIQELVDTIGKDYSQKVKAFEKDRETVINASTAATEKLSNATEEYKDSLVEIQTKLKYSLIVNAISLAAIAAILFFLLK
ncbi:hypothetical protein [Prevotella sp. E2-28]|uniref:hypothetical protein n=1 Tax=Prevotella sp. E2-28 TaxID=2913620 RepID=UPI001ED9C9D5|nr:hypothetical protein [Prevotella sp. E2-28]UKK53052.1 hypothetical protein L6465_10725 [Prevotella sp. E2-28]